MFDMISRRYPTALLLSLSLASCVAFSGAAHAQTATTTTSATASTSATTTATISATATTSAKAESEWTQSLTPYLWLSGIKGDIGAKDRKVSVDAKFTDIFSKIKFAGMLSYEAHRAKISYLIDLVYTDLKDDVPFNVPLPGGTVKPGHAELKSNAWIISPVAAYRVAESERGFTDVTAGARLWFQETQLKLKVKKSNPNWIDPIIGARSRIALSPKWTASILGDIGGFGIGSKFTWQLVGAFHLKVGERNSAVIGYRTLDVDYRKGGSTYNVNQYGPILGFTFGL
jgi:hypothetical protein